MKVEFSGQVFEKSSNMKFHENPSCESRVVPCGQTGQQTCKRTERYGEANGRPPPFFFLRTPNNSVIAEWHVIDEKMICSVNLSILKRIVVTVIIIIIIIIIEYFVTFSSGSSINNLTCLLIKANFISFLRTLQYDYKWY